MGKRVFIIHGWDGSPQEGWFPWLKEELKKKGFFVRVPTMPHPARPTIKSWVNYLDKLVGKVDEDTYFVGHSIGCQTILRYLQNINKRVGGVIFLAGWFSLTKEAMPSKEEKKIAEPWLGKPIKLDRFKKNTKNIVAIFSDNDPYVPSENKNIFRNKLNAKIIVLHKKGHFSGSDGIKKLPLVLNELLKMSKPKF